MDFCHYLIIMTAFPVAVPHIAMFFIPLAIWIAFMNKNSICFIGQYQVIEHVQVNTKLYDVHLWQVQMG